MLSSPDTTNYRHQGKYHKNMEIQEQPFLWNILPVYG